jgi:hypothetical protein
MMTEPEDDPFGMFGENESDGETEAIPPAEDAQFCSRTLVDAANNRSRGCVEDDGHATISFRMEHVPDNSGADPVNEGNDKKGVGQPRLAALPWRAPLYLAPAIQLVSDMESVGGGRGYVLSRDPPDAEMPAGTLALVEAPLIEWPEEQIGHELGLISVQHILRTLDATSLHELEHLHPTKQVVDQIVNERDNGVNDDAHNNESSFETQVVQMMHDVREQHKNDPQLQEMIRLAARRGLLNSNGAPLIDTDCFRLLLVLRYNGLQSGIYLHVAMLNHSDQPNCVKFMPSADSRSQARFSEVRTTRPVRPGEALTIHYLSSIRSHATRRSELWEQHRFDIGASRLSSSLLAMELVQGVLPPSSLKRRNNEAVTRQVEFATEELRQLYDEASSSLSSLSPRLSPSQNIHSSSSEDSMIEQIRSLELASHELVVSAQEQLGNQHHILLIPALELHLDSASLVLQYDSSLKPSSRASLLGRMTGTSLHLVTLQEQLYGTDHYALARTNLDVAQSIEELISRSPQTLLRLRDSNYTFPTTMLVQPTSRIVAWAALEHRVRKEYERIRDLYPHDSSNMLLDRG